MIEPHFMIQINDLEPVNLQDFLDSPLLPEYIYALKLDLNATPEHSLDLVALMMLLETFLSRVKNNTEYSTLLNSLINNMIIVRKLENDAKLGDYRY